MSHSLQYIYIYIYGQLINIILRETNSTRDLFISVNLKAKLTVEFCHVKLSFGSPTKHG